MKNFRRYKAVFAAVIAGSALLAVQAPAADAAPPDQEILADDLVDVTTQYGDVNFDRSVNISDSVQMLRFLHGNTGKLGNWKNADINSDEEVDIFDYILLNQQITGQSEKKGGTLSVKVVDMMTGEPLVSAGVHLWGSCSDYAYSLGDWTYTPEDDTVFSNVPTGEDYVYYIDLDNLPEGYGNQYGNWDQQLSFSYDGTEDKEVVVRVLADDTERNVHFGVFNWSEGKEREYWSVIDITDKNGEPYYPYLHTSDIALPDGEYHAELKMFDYPLTPLDVDGEFADMLRERYPDIEFTDKSGGIDFTVKNGKADKELRFDLAPIMGKGNKVTVNCIDTSTGQPLEGVEISLTEAPDSYAKKIASWTSDASGTTSFDDLYFTGEKAYKISIDKIPEGYTGGFDEYLHWGYAYNYTCDINYYFTPDSAEKNISSEIIDINDGSVLNDLCTFEIYKLTEGFSSEKVLTGITPGEKVSLKDGKYYAALQLYNPLDKPGYKGIPLIGKNAAVLPEGIDTSAFIGYTSIIEFTVKDGKADNDLRFYVTDAVFETEEEEIPEKD
ncbi:MAG: hypothetical protein IKQ90_05210 [Ruminococcus sp.]|nr:hypothetical protein [Ruminococcus sp.]